ncbi:helix-turn-helix domain-containing protein [Marinomonas sp. A79]|uniref:Helix-turn-helix domain-containing protein n=1 Tax=Marinomonas vulgaris TaxID=2823372 RepID=A0ABS5H932_9GAMM|nr:AraC family transcriptional regulator [Marinomonas vulgaris]MBR7887534.1 helix-turn-helix domain-containing protein [Marinomonas vulgaris]
MTINLSIRAYSKQLNRHAHDAYHQLVLPVKGSIHMGEHLNRVMVGECVVIPAGVTHVFKADEAARFIVADMNALPMHLVKTTSFVFTVSPPLLSFLYFVEKQLEHQVDSGLEFLVATMFYQLLEQQDTTGALDSRIRSAQTIISEQLDQSLSIEVLAAAAFLGPTQFKKRFKECVGLSVYQYIIQQRMEKAKALLTHTDWPVVLIAEKVGYTDLSAFSRRFSLYFGVSPRAFSRA